MKPSFSNTSFLILLVSCILVSGLSGCSKRVYSVHPIIKVPACPPKPKPIKDIGVAVALGTGGFRGIAHAGVLDVFEKEGIPIDLIVGTSAGSMVGAFYCAAPKIDLIRDRVMALTKQDLVDSMDIPLKGNELESFILKNLPVKNFEELKIPFVAVATSLNSNEAVILRSGPIMPAIHASSAMPHFFAPVCLYGQNLIDGGVLQAVPVEVARLYKPKMVIAVNVYPPAPTKPVKTNQDLFNRAVDVSYYKFCCMQTQKADVGIYPDLVGFELFDDKRNKEAYERGRKAAMAALPRIKAEMAKRGISLKPRHKHR